MIRRMALATLAILAFGGVAQAQVDRAGAQKDWSVFAEGTGDRRVCWMQSAPRATEARRGGKRVTANRGDPFLMVSVRPAEKVRNEVSTIVGYTLKKDSRIAMAIGGAKFDMFTLGDKAWLLDASQDDRVVEAMKKGAEATLTAVSERGTTTIDTYSLSGFTAALNEAQGLCK